MSREECIRQLKTDPKRGLTVPQVEQRSREYGQNELREGKRPGLIAKFLEQFKDFMVIILLIAAAVSFFTSLFRHDSDYIDPIIILLIVIVNAVIGVAQESRAEKAIDALKKLTSPESVVMRNGKRIKIASKEIVPGDIVFLTEGDFVPADLRILEAHNLRAEESALTGESLPVEKSAELVCGDKTPLGDRKNMLYSSSSVAAGRGVGVAVATGMETQVGKIAHMIHSEEAPQTPLQKRLAHTGKVLGIGALAICAVIFIMGLIQSVEPLDMFMISISLAVAAIPEGLPAVVTIVLAMGVRRMANCRAIVRRMPAVETLGSASVICSDKTGTLTQNKMTVVEVAGYDGVLTKQDTQARRILELAALCNNCTVSGDKIQGDPTEAALLAASPVPKDQLERRMPRVREIPFQSARKMMTTVHRLDNQQYRIITKGAPDLLMERCTTCQGGSFTAPMDQQVRRELQRRNEQMASRALRVLGVAYRDVKQLPPENEWEKDLVFCGFIGMIDPPRPEAERAVRLCKKAGIRAVMITGDHVATAVAIAGKLGMMGPEDKALTGQQLDQMEQRDLERNIYQYSVFARVSPEHKVRIVKAFQKRGEIVAMTGDGVNDAPALKAADIGCAMGISGTDVAKGAADMVLTDDNFATIVEAVREGRGIYANIRKTIHFLISCNIGEILTVFMAFLLQLPLPLLAIQLLWINLVTDSLPALALGVEPIENDVMEQPPHRQNESIFAGGMGYNILVEGCLIGALALLAYSVGRAFFDMDPSYPIIGRTMAFATLSLSQIVHSYNMRSSHSLFRIGFLSNPQLLVASVICTIMQVSVIAVAPVAQIFKTAVLSGAQWVAVALISLVPFVVVEAEKALLGATSGKKENEKRKILRKN
ncbi:calcium-translocating P-type ATPase, PMCA-type [Clostridium sp. MSTE9]|uniref:calcium-translocating P-type ATPase, PMCA-type n=1 Tax=Clostridium sp. (strain MSTE9) TaxID=1105031 RepID=UPI00026F3BD2|nr:calcium-translocating P-type ATPase, PMCA-type [Clostridium sp. MSTE9]EJF38733.1 calcium-translocating P-type ATPase, PMCA-type [Clostridium sp. MSTE9]